jgi:hypothetical protein
MPQAEAESRCISEGGHLASVHSRDELEAAGRVVGDYGEGYWLGAFLNTAGRWAWTDGSPFDWDNWDTEDPDKKYGSLGAQSNCTVIWDDLTWWDRPCTDSIVYRVLCQNYSQSNNNVLKSTGNESTTLIFNRGSTLITSFKIWWQYKIRNQTVPSEHRPFSGFRLNWHVENEQGVKAENGEGEMSVEQWTPAKGPALYQNTLLVKMVNLVLEAKTKNITAERLVSEALTYKMTALAEGSLTYLNGNLKCLNGEVSKEHKGEVVEGFEHHVGIQGGIHVIRQVVIL